MTQPQPLPWWSWNSALEVSSHVPCLPNIHCSMWKHEKHIPTDIVECEKTCEQRAFDPEDFKLSLTTDTFFLSPLYPELKLQEIIASEVHLGCIIVRLKSNALIKCLFWDSTLMPFWNKELVCAQCWCTYFFRKPFSFSKTGSQGAVIIFCVLLWLFCHSTSWVFSQWCGYIVSKLHCRKKISGCCG